MKQPPKFPKPKSVFPGPKLDADKQQKKAELVEVLGMHKNAGQKDHKGAR